MNSVMKPTWENFKDYWARRKTEHPYTQPFVTQCRKEALRYSRMSSKYMRKKLLNDLFKTTPEHIHEDVFAGINFEFIKEDE